MINLQMKIHLPIDDLTGTIIFTFSDDNYSILLGSSQYMYGHAFFYTKTILHIRSRQIEMYISFFMYV